MTSQPATQLSAITPGARVVYSGSLTELHGPATVVGHCLCCYTPGWTPTRVELELPDGQALLHVRRSSCVLAEGSEDR